MSNTPETDAAVIYRGKYAKIGDKWDRSQCGEITEPGEEGELIPGAEWGDVVLLPADFARRLERERDDLRRWKTEALAVMPPYQEIGREIGATIGSSIHDKILPELIRRREEIASFRRELITTTTEGGETSIYLIETRTFRLRRYNPKFGDDRECECGHPYYRHFDWGDEDSGCSCKYCGCNDFLEVDPLVVPD